MTKRDGVLPGKTAHFDPNGNGSRRSPSRNDFFDGDMRPSSPSKNNPQAQRSSLGGYNEGNFNVYRDSRSAPNSMPGSAAGSRANSRPGSRPGSRLQSRCNSQESIIDLFDSMTLKYGQTQDGNGPIEFRTPKAKRLANTKMSYSDRVRINSAVWRSWHIQYIKKKKSAVCQFSSPLPETSTRLVSDVIQGKTALTGYRPEELGVVVRNYNKWRTVSKDVLTHRPVIQHSFHDNAEDNAIDLNSPHPPLSPGTGGKLVNDDLFKDFADTLFISRKKKHFTVPAPKKVTHMINYIPEYLQPDLSTLLPEVDAEFMEAISSFEAILSKTPLKNDPRHLGIMDELPSALYFNPDPDNLNLMDVEMPQVVQAASTSQHQAFPNFPYEQSPPTPQKSVSFSSPSTPHESAASSPGYQLPAAYDFSGPIQGFQHDSQQQQHQPHTSHQSPVMQPGHMNNFDNSFHGTTDAVHGQNVAPSLVQQHPVLLQTLRNAPSLPHPSGNTISTHHVPVRSDARSPASSTPSPSAPKTPEPKLEPVSPASSGCMGGNSPVVTKPNTSTISVGNFTYHLADPNLLANLHPQTWQNDKQIQWNTMTTTTTSGGQGFEDLGSHLVTIRDNTGHHTISIRNDQIIGSNRVPIFQPFASGGGEEKMDCSSFPSPLPQTSGEFRQPADVSLGSGLRSPGGSKRPSSGQISSLHADAPFRKKSSGGLEHAMPSPRDERETHPKSIPSSSHASNASSAASSPGNDENFESFYNSTKRKNRDINEDKDDRVQRRKRKHLDSEHKRRNNIQNCLDELQKVIPNLPNGNSSRDQVKISTAVLLQRAQEYIHSLQDQMQQLRSEEEEMKGKIQSLNDEIEQCQDALPDTGAPVNSQNDTQLYQMLDEYIDSEMEKNWKFWIFSKFARPLFKSFLGALKVSTGASISGDLTKWVEESCKLRQLRTLALGPVKQISKETSVLTDPSNLPEQVLDIARRESLARKSTPPPDL